MTDQTQRLELATVKAEIGSDIISRFSNDAFVTAEIPTDSGDIPNLKQVIADIENKASISTSIYPDVATGLSATAEGGMFLVASVENDEIYAVWKKVGGIAVDTGKRALSSQTVEDAAVAADASAAEAAASELAAQEAAANAAADFQVIFDNDQIAREAEFNQLLLESGFESVHLTYVPGTPLSVARPTQLINYSGSVYRVKMPASFPVSLTGTWATDQLLLVDVGDISLRQGLLSSAGLKMLGFKSPWPGAVDRSAYDKASEVVSVKDFGAYCDGHLGVAGHDDSAAVQAAVNYCLSMDPPAMLEVPGLCRIDSPVLIERFVDSASAQTYFTIKGTGDGAGFYAHYGVTMFDAYPSHTSVWIPESQKVRFQDLAFKSFAPTNPTWAIEGRRFLGVDFVNCSFHKMRCARNESYYQTWYFINCSAFGFIGTFLESTGGSYDVHFIGCKIQAGTKFIDITQNQAHGQDRTNFYVTDCHVQAMTSQGITADSCTSVRLSGVYFEYCEISCNFATSNNLSGASPNHSINISGCLFASKAENIANPAYFDILWGRTSHGFAAGNYVSGNTIEGIGTKLHKIEAAGVSKVTLIAEPGYSGVWSTEPAFAGGGLVQTGVGGEALRTVRGKISSAGAIIRGSGFTVAKTGTGKYKITFTTIFSDEPDITVMALDSGGTVFAGMDTGGGTPGISAEIQFRSGATPVDATFHFICTGAV